MSPAHSTETVWNHISDHLNTRKQRRRPVRPVVSLNKVSASSFLQGEVVVKHGITLIWNSDSAALFPSISLSEWLFKVMICKIWQWPEVVSTENAYRRALEDVILPSSRWPPSQYFIWKLKLTVEGEKTKQGGDLAKREGSLAKAAERTY